MKLIFKSILPVNENTTYEKHKFTFETMLNALIKKAIDEKMEFKTLEVNLVLSNDEIKQLPDISNEPKLKININGKIEEIPYYGINK